MFYLTYDNQEKSLKNNSFEKLCNSYKMSSRVSNSRHFNVRYINIKYTQCFLNFHHTLVSNLR